MIFYIISNSKEGMGRQKLFGAIGTALTAPIVGKLIELSGHWVIFTWSYAFTLILGFTVMYTTPTFINERKEENSIKRTKSIYEIFDWKLTGVCFLVFVLKCCTIIRIDYMNLAFSEMGFSHDTLGFAITMGTTSEFIIFIFGDKALDICSYRYALLIGFVFQSN